MYDCMYVCIAEIARLSEELNALKGSEEDRSPMSHDASSSSWSAPTTTSATTSTSTSGQPIAALETEDLWLGVQVDTNTCGFLKMYVCMYACMNSDIGRLCAIVRSLCVFYCRKKWIYNCSNR